MVKEESIREKVVQEIRRKTRRRTSDPCASQRPSIESRIARPGGPHQVEGQFGHAERVTAVSFRTPETCQRLRAAAQASSMNVRMSSGFGRLPAR